MIQHESIIASHALHWGHSSLLELLDEEQRTKLLDREVHSWLSDLFWGEMLALRFARLRLNIAPAGRRKIWERVVFDEMNHFGQLALWFEEKKELPSQPNLYFQSISSELQRLENNFDPMLMAQLSDVQVFLEILISKLIQVRHGSVCDGSLLRIFDRVLRDEVFHVGAGMYELGKANELSVVRKYRNKIFPLHLARGVLSMNQYILAKARSEAIVQAFIDNFASTSQNAQCSSEGEHLCKY